MVRETTLPPSEISSTPLRFSFPPLEFHYFPLKSFVPSRNSDFPSWIRIFPYCADLCSLPSLSLGFLKPGFKNPSREGSRVSEGPGPGTNPGGTQPKVR